MDDCRAALAALRAAVALALRPEADAVEDEAIAAEAVEGAAGTDGSRGDGCLGLRLEVRVKVVLETFEFVYVWRAILAALELQAESCRLFEDETDGFGVPAAE